MQRYAFKNTFALLIPPKTTQKLECEFPPKSELDLTLLRRKRMTTISDLVCLEDYPYTVSIRLHGRHWCGGAIIGKHWIVTAAQSFDYIQAVEVVTVRMGSVFRDYGGIIMSVLEIRRHPNYNMHQYYPEHNLAILKVNSPITFSNRIQPVALPPFDTGTIPSTGEMIVTGFGSVYSGQIREGVDQELRRMMVVNVDKAKCRRLYGNDYRLQFDHMCLESKTKGVALCAGDTGDPAVHFSGYKKSGTLFGIAIFSGSEECSAKSKPGIFARIAPSKKWIDEVLFLEVNDDLSVDSMQAH